MYLHTILTPDRVVVPLGAATLQESMAILIEGLQGEGLVDGAEELLHLVETAAMRDLVTIGSEIVLLHLRTELVDQLIITMGTSPHPLALPGSSLPGSSVRLEPKIVILVLAPPGAATLYLQTISALTGALRKSSLVDQILGARTPDQILEIPQFGDLKIQPRLIVRDIMTHRSPSVSPETTLRDAVTLLVRNRVRAIPVVGEKEEVLGIISEWDVMRALLPHLPRAGGGEDDAIVIPEELRVREIMSRSVLCIDEEMGVDEAANMMINKDVEQFPVVSEGRLSGFLTRGDIIRKLFGR